MEKFHSTIKHNNNNDTAFHCIIVYDADMCCFCCCRPGPGTYAVDTWMATFLRFNKSIDVS